MNQKISAVVGDNMLTIYQRRKCSERGLVRLR